jgi:hypothetical protein
MLRLCHCLYFNLLKAIVSGSATLIRSNS